MKITEGEMVSASNLYDRAEALERLDGDEELFGSLAELFVGESASYCSALEAALAAGDAAALCREAHSTKSMLATFSYEDGRVVALQLERLAAGGSLDGAPALTEQVIAAVKRLADELAKGLA